VVSHKHSISRALEISNWKFQTGNFEAFSRKLKYCRPRSVICFLEIANEIFERFSGYTFGMFQLHPFSQSAVGCCIPKHPNFDFIDRIMRMSIVKYIIAL
jgi:hypothetical protein